MFAFNGQITDSEWMDGQSTVFEARIYESRLGRWLSVDPLESKYPSLSSYNFAASSPIILLDPDGRKIKIHYIVNGKSKYFDYTPGMKLPENVDQFIKDVHEAITHAIKYDPNNVFQKLHKSKHTVVIESKLPVYTQKNPYDDINNARFTKVTKDTRTNELLDIGVLIKWSPTTGVMTTEGEGMSATTILHHEGGHAVRMVNLKTEDDFNQFIKDANSKSSKNKELYGKDYHTAEEKRNITEIENTYVIELNKKQLETEGVRKNHFGTPYETKGVTTIEPVNSNFKVKGIPVKIDEIIFEYKWGTGSASKSQTASSQEKIPLSKDTTYGSEPSSEESYDEDLEQ